MSQMTKTGTFPHGLKIGDQVYTNFVMREVEVADWFDAESECGGPRFALQWKAQLAVRQLVKVTNKSGGEFTGPFVVSMLKKPADFSALIQVMEELEELGNGEQSASASGGTPSS